MELALALFDSFPALIQRTEVPTAARLADHPQPSLLLVEGQAFPDRKVLDGLVAAEVTVAVDAGLEHSNGNGTGAIDMVGLSIL